MPDIVGVVVEKDIVYDTSKSDSDETGESGTGGGVVFGSPVSKPEKNRDWTGPRLIRTANSQDRKRPKTAVRSSVLHNLGNSRTGLFTTKASSG
jgi:hypothetical protein